jgi:FkbM family methyltransferase
MGVALDAIRTRVSQAPPAHGFLDYVLGQHKEEALRGAPVVLFGAGALGAEMAYALKNHGIQPVAVCDNGATPQPRFLEGVPIIGFPELKSRFGDALIVITSKRFQAPITQQLTEAGFSPERVKCSEADPLAHLSFLYSMRITQLCVGHSGSMYPRDGVLERLEQSEASLEWVYERLADQKSRDLMVAKLSFLASGGNLKLFRDFMFQFSEPVLAFGIETYAGPPEDYYYFTNDVLTLSSDETYLDVGAFDGDTVLTFQEACSRAGIVYRKIHAFEPDPDCFERMLANTQGVERLTCHSKGLWSESTTLRFKSSGQAAHDQAAAISGEGDCEIEVLSLDDFLGGEAVTFLKADPGGNVIPQVVEGAKRTLQTHRPKLALGAYHSLEAIFEIPKRVKELVPEYQIFLRHHTYHLCDTDLLATI